MAWVFLVLAGFFEVVWAVALKYSENFTKIMPTIIFFVTASLSVLLLNLSMKMIPLGTAYAVWTGIGIIGTVLFGAIFFGEPITIIKIVCFSFIVFGILGLRLVA
jgi:quaternary ammonium compound-resistance protein SugE